MQYALVSDIHANLQAWNAALIDIRNLGVDRIICLGDIVGYGPHPAEVLQSVHANVDHLVLGNHDAVVCGKMDASLFNDDAQAIIAWTQTQLNAEARRFLGSLPLSLEGRTFRCTHGDFSEPAAFNYVIDAEEAVPSWDAVPHSLLFVGHTHRPAIFVRGASGRPHVVDPQDFALEEGKRFLVNAPSIGQPRDGKAMAGYCVYDTESGSVCWRSVPFDIDAYRNAIERTGIPAGPSYFLRHDPRAGTPPLRELLNFSPATTPDQVVKDAVEVQDLTVLRRRVTKWKILAGVLLCAGLAVAAGAGTLWWRHATRSQTLAGRTLAPIPSISVGEDVNILPMPDTPLPAGSVIPGWRVHLGNKRQQAVGVEETVESGLAFAMVSSNSRDELCIESAPVLVKQGQRLCLQALFRRSDDFRGAVAAAVCLTRDTDAGRETVRHFLVKEPNVPRQGGWLEARRTFEIPARAVSVTVQVRGKFTGRADITAISLTRRE